MFPPLRRRYRRRLRPPAHRRRRRRLPLRRPRHFRRSPPVHKIIGQGRTVARILVRPRGRRPCQ